MIIFNLRCKFFLQTASKTKIEIMKTIITLTLSSLLFIITACNLKKEKISQHHFHGNTSHVHSHTKNTTDYFDEYVIEDKEFGTKTEVTISGNNRIIKTNALPNHKTGEFPTRGNPNKISAQKRTYTIPLHPVYTGKPKWAREPGIALNGIKFEPQTAEVIVCDTGEHYRVEAKQNLINLGLDFNNAHVQPTGAYHYHGTPTSIISIFDKGEDLVHIGFALDGFPIYYSKSGKYKPSYRLKDKKYEGEDCTYSTPHHSKTIKLNNQQVDGKFVSDWEFDKNYGDLDEANGITVNGRYMYLVTDIYPFIGRYLMGEFKEERRRGPPPNGRRPQRGQRPDGPPPTKQ